MSTPPNTMSFLEHFNDLRKRLLRALIALAIGTMASFSLGDRLLQILLVPIGGMENIQSIEVTENISVFMRISLLAGFITALPVITYQLLAFILPGLKPSEKRFIFLSIPFITIMFLGGVAFSYYIMLPAAIPFLVGFLGIPTTPRLANYIAFVTSLLFWIGISFQMPLVVYILARIGLVTAGALAKQWRLAVVGIAILAAVISPTVDPINMGLLMLPLLVLYALSILMALIAVRKRK
jgi:sec-independent protein translocase protein TatC